MLIFHLITTEYFLCQNFFSNEVVRNMREDKDHTRSPSRSDAMTALEVMAENVSVYKAVITLLNLGKGHKSAVVKGNMASLVDSIISR